MNLLQKTEQLWTKCIKKAVERKFQMEELQQPFDYMEYAEGLWKQELIAIKTRLAPKYMELEAVLKECNIIKKDNSTPIEGRYCMITLRPEEGAVNLHRFIFDVKELAHKNLFNKGEWVFEQSGETEEEAGKGFHAHMLMSVKDYVQVKDILNACKFIKYNCMIQVGRKTGQKFIRGEKDLNFATNYIRGDKHDASKEIKVNIDKLWRPKKGIEEIYTK